MGSIKQVIQQCIDTEMPTIEVGVVTSADPVEMVLEDDIRITLSELSLVIPSGKRPFVLNERLYLLSLYKGKIYYVLDRV
ncbi:MAG: hypothetical protein Q4B26_17485 [Eubacteriales bacterium]|nr:hypothetical protein [Eubacteriales bacterium]